MARIVKESHIDASPAAVFAFHERPDALRLLTPPWEPVEVLEMPKSLEVGSRAALRIRLGPVPIDWVAEHVEYTAGRSFADAQVEGPFRSWLHRHEMLDDGRGGTLYRDEIAYELPLGSIGAWIGGEMVRSRLERMLDYRHEVVRTHCQGPDASRRVGTA